jgi:uncharacterized membrane protein YgaE (UPF0421/DUF939 family)
MVKKFWNWKYRNHTICFIIGVILSSLFWLRMGGEDRKLAEKNLKEEKKKTEQLQKELTKLSTLLKETEDFKKDVDALKEINVTLLKENEKLKNKKIPTVGTLYDDELTDSITKWAYKIRGYSFQ